MNRPRHSGNDSSYRWVGAFVVLGRAFERSRIGAHAGEEEDIIVKRIVCALLTSGVILLAQAGKTASKPVVKAELALFDGRSLAGWHQEGEAKWRVAGGAIVADASGDGWLRSDKAYTNFVLSIEYRNSPKGNSGVFLRATKETKPTEQCNPVDAYEFQINNEDAKYATGSVEDVIQRLVAVNPAPNQWHKVEITVRGNHIAATLDSQKVLDGSDSKLKSGYIGLQHHKDMKIEFRRIRISDLAPDR